MMMNKLRTNLSLTWLQLPCLAATLCIVNCHQLLPDLKGRDPTISLCNTCLMLSQSITQTAQCSQRIPDQDQQSDSVSTTHSLLSRRRTRMSIPTREALVKLDSHLLFAPPLKPSTWMCLRQQINNYPLFHTPLNTPSQLCLTSERGWTQMKVNWWNIQEGP